MKKKWSRTPHTCDNCSKEYDCDREEFWANRGCEDWGPKSAFKTYTFKRKGSNGD